MHPDLTRDGAASSRQLRSIRNRLPGLVATGVLLKPYPGVYVLASRAQDVHVRLLAAQLALPRGVVIGPAARAFLDPEVPFATIDMAMPAQGQPRRGIRQHRLVVPDVMEIGGVRLPDPAWNAVWSAAFDDGEGIDHHLRAGGTLADLQRVIGQFDGMAGSRIRRRVLAETKEDSWSTGERRLHRLLREHGVDGWRANVRVRTTHSPRGMVVDVVFRRERVAVEFDGWEFHSSRAAFENDRARSAELASDGWTVLRFTWRQVAERPDWVVSCLRGALSRAESRLAA